MKQFLIVVLICILLIANHVQHLFKCLFPSNFDEYQSLKTTKEVYRYFKVPSDINNPMMIEPEYHLQNYTRTGLPVQHDTDLQVNLVINSGFTKPYFKMKLFSFIF